MSMMNEDRLSAILAASERGDTDFVEASQEYVTDLVAEIARLTADRDAWRDALQHVACRLGGTGAGSPDDVRLACDDLGAAGGDYQRERDELRALVREHFAAEAVLCDVVERRARLYESPSFSPHESREIEHELAATVLRTDAARAALVAKVTP